MADHRTTLTELVTGLGTLGFDDIEAALTARPPEMVSVSPEQWDLLDDLHRGGAYRQEFVAAWQNGRAFLAAAEGLRRRRPLVIEWRGGQKQPGDEPVPADLRIDHVFLISCKYLSQIVTNTSPAAVFDRLLAGGHGQSRRLGAGRSEAPQPPPARPSASASATTPLAGEAPTSETTEVCPTCGQAAVVSSPGDAPLTAGRSVDVGGAGGQLETLAASDSRPGGPEPLAGGRPAASSRPGGPERAVGGQLAEVTAGGGRSVDWYAEVAPDAYQALYRAAVERCGLDELPGSVHELTQPQRLLLKARLGRGRWSPELRPIAVEWSAAVAEASARRWQQALAGADPERVLWRLLRIGSAPYFVLGVAKQGSLRLRVATAWDWRQYFRITDVTVAGRADNEQPVVKWKFEVAHKRGHQRSTIEGHVEIRWSHGKFAQPPEAKVYLDTPHHRIPGYWRLT